MQLPDGNTLMHAGAPYDPVKAHEYYLKNRELKGRKRGSAPAFGNARKLAAPKTLDAQKKAAWNNFLKQLPMAVEGADVKKTEAFVKSFVGKSDAHLREAAKNMKSDPGFNNADIKRKTVEALLERRTKAQGKAASPKDTKLSPKQYREKKAAATRHVASLKKTLSKLNAELKDKLAKAKESERKAKQPDTASEKSKKAREAAKYQDKHKQEIAAKSKKAASKKTPDKSKPGSVESLKRQIASVQQSLNKAEATLKALG